MVDKLIADANVGNLGYSIERINDIANATEEEQAAFGMTSDEVNSIKQQLPKIVELAARVEEVYQSNLNETGNRTMASIITNMIYLLLNIIKYLQKLIIKFLK